MLGLSHNYEVKIGNETHVLEVMKKEYYTLYTMYTKRNGLELPHTRTCKQRLSKDTKDFFNVK